MAAPSILGAPSVLTSEQRAEYEARARQEWEARFVERIRYALLVESALATQIVETLALVMEANDRLAARVRKALPKRGANGRPGSRRARHALVSYETSLSLYEVHSPGKRGNKARALRDAAEWSKLDEKTIERLIAKGNTRK